MMDKTIVLYTTYYTEKTQERQTELLECIKNNTSTSIDKIYLLVEKDDNIDKTDPIFGSKKLEIVIVDSRVTFKYMFEFINKTIANNSQVSVVTNSDIYLDEDGINKLKTYNLENIALALSRWDVLEDKSIRFNRCPNWSQDCWIFSGPVKTVNYADFFFGIPGCDNRIACELMFAGYIVLNVGTHLKTYHLHADETRDWSKLKTIRPPYFLVKVTPDDSILLV